MSSDTLAAAREAFGEGENLSFEDIQTELAQLKPELDKYKLIKERYDALREAATYEMLASGVKSTLPKNGFSLVLSERITPVIVDEEATWDWLSDNVDDIEKFLKLDTTKVIDFTDKWFAETGEIVPGIESRSTQYVSVKSVKGKK